MWRLSAQEFSALAALIASAYVTTEDLGVMLQLLGRNIEDLTAPNAKLQHTIAGVILAAQANGWLPELIGAIKKDKPERADIQAFTLPNLEAAAAGTDPYDDFIVRRVRVLLDRSSLRDAVRSLEQGDSYRFLVVTGGEKTGKTYSRHFITHIFERRHSFELGWVNLLELYRREEGPLTPEPVARRLFSYLKIDPALLPPKDDEKYERWSQRACDALIRALPPLQPGAPRLAKWLMIDGFNSVPLHDGTIAFIEEVARQVEATLTDVRLILLGWKGLLPEDAEDLALRENCGPIPDDEIKNFFERLFKDRWPALTDVDLARRVAQSIAKVKRAVPPNAAMINAVLGDAVSREWAELQE